MSDNDRIKPSNQPDDSMPSLSTEGNLFNTKEIQQIMKWTDKDGDATLLLVRNNTSTNSNTPVGESEEDLQNIKNIAVKNSSDNADSLTSNKKPYYTATEIASEYGWSAQVLNDYLMFKQIQKKEGDKWKPLKKYISEGFVYQTHWFRHTNYRWTEKGKRFIEDQLKADGIKKVR